MFVLSIRNDISNPASRRHSLSCKQASGQRRAIGRKAETRGKTRQPAHEQTATGLLESTHRPCYRWQFKSPLGIWGFFEQKQTREPPASLTYALGVPGRPVADSGGSSTEHRHGICCICIWWAHCSTTASALSVEARQWQAEGASTCKSRKPASWKMARRGGTICKESHRVVQPRPPP